MNCIRYALVILILLILLSPVYGENLTYNPEVLIDQNGNYNTSSVLYNAYLNTNFNDYITIDIHAIGLNETVWCEFTNEIKTSNIELKEATYDEELDGCVGRFFTPRIADISNLQSCSNIADQTTITERNRCDLLHEELNNELKNSQRLTILVIIIFILGILSWVGYYFHTHFSYLVPTEGEE